MMETGVAETFRNGIVLITGSTGFLGKILTEKLLRSCPVKNIVVLVRRKKELNASQRVAKIYQQTLFDRIRHEKPDFIKSIKIIEGNLEESSLGLSLDDHDWMIENVNFVFHCAATVKFNETLELASKINIQGTEHLLALASKMKNLKGFVHVSTAYSHCPRKEIKEEYYTVPVTVTELKNMLVDNVPTAEIIEDWPNTYTFTKAVAENMIMINENRLPISIFRPSIIGCTESEPEPGWLENMNGPTGLISGVMVGFLRTAPNIGTNITDIIPADYTVNALISVMWDTVNRHKQSNIVNKVPKIYNYVSCVESPLTWGRYIREMHDQYYVAPPLQSMWYGFYILYTHFMVGSILRFFLHRIPGAFMDLLLILCGKSPKMLRMYAKTESMVDLIYEFSTKQWKFDNTNTRQLWLSLSKDDRNMFQFSLKSFDWKSYIESYYYGIRKHILHEDLSNVKEALSKNKKLLRLHQLCVVLVIYITFHLCWIFMNYLF
ncbi:fatty acyl-CoA reductase wat-like isoform X1 [Metopolophium dirhodum]|uniref:fatty acyl-CoA reductase wat-like isoform X1 n=2 Tax=Metopolophium dirhodum TaxID=44670 RepID=UPI00298F62CB|nr:fatty acyl-CoA reductase wat-like isoform X1 [Metopolophium dirhodum]